MEEVVGLEQHVAELGVGDALVGAGQPGLHRVLGHHLVDGEVLPDVPQEVEQGQGLEPVSVVDQEGTGPVVGPGVREVEEAVELLPDALEVGAELIVGQ
jgi:hypothetical protein